MTTRVVVEADGASRGNPGPASYGAALRDAETGEVIAEDGDVLGVATNNVAEYNGLVAGLRLAADHAPGAEVEVRMDSKLVVEQMAGNWKINKAELRALADAARALAPAGTTWTWIPRADNSYADQLANDALDGVRSGVVVSTGSTDGGPGSTDGGPGSTDGGPGSTDGGPGSTDDADSLIEEIQDPDTAPVTPARGWSPPGGPPTTLVLVRHGVTQHTQDKRFSGGLASSNPGLSEEGRDQVRATAEWLLPLADEIDVVVASPVRRTKESAEIVAEMLGKAIEEEPGFAEMEFGHWDGLTFAEVAERFPEELDAWLGSLDEAPKGGESFRVVEERVLAGLQRLLDAHGGRTVVVVSHVTPIKTLVAHAVDAPLSSVFRMELSPASVSVIAFFTGGKDGSEARASMRMYNAVPAEIQGIAGGPRW